MHKPIRSYSGERIALLIRFLSAVSDLNPCALFRGYLIAMIPLLSDYSETSGRNEAFLSGMWKAFIKLITRILEFIYGKGANGMGMREILRMLGAILFFSLSLLLLVADSQKTKVAG